MYLRLLTVIIGFFLLWMFSFYTSKKIILTPQFGYVGFFLISAFYAVFYAKEWELEMKFETAFVLLGGALIFTFVSIALQVFLGQIYGEKKIYFNKEVVDEKAKKISVGICFLILVLQMFTLIWTIISLIKNVSGNGLAEIMYAYRYASLFGEDKISLPSLLLNLRHFSCASGYIWSYLLIYSFLQKISHNRKIYILNIIFSVLNSIILGGRGGALQLIFAAVVQWYFLRGALKGWTSKLEIKSLLRITLLFAVIVISFQMLGTLMGRTSTKTVGHYIADYMSAEIKNLEIFLGYDSFGTDFSHCQTMIYVANFWGKLTGNMSIVHELDLPFRYVNGYGLGNVATAYYAYIYDKGYFGVLIYTTLMAVICQMIFQRMIRKNRSNKLLSMSIIVYSYVYFLISFSFFSNKFYENVFTLTFVKYLISWWIIKILLEKVHFKKIRKVNKQC